MASGCGGQQRQLVWPLVMAATPVQVEAEMRALQLRITQLQTLQRLLQEWLPACFTVGCKVRNCSWAGEEAGSWVQAKEVVMAAAAYRWRVPSGGV